MAQVSLTSILSAELAKLDHAQIPHVWLDQELGIVVGTYPNGQFSYDFIGDQLSAVSEENLDKVTDPKVRQKKEEVSLLHLAERITDVYEIETQDMIYRVGSAKQALLIGLEKIEELVPGTLAELAKCKGRTKRPVSLDREQLYDRKSQMRYSERLKNGFWVATNNKTPEALEYVRKAASIAGLTDNEFQLRK